MSGEAVPGSMLAARVRDDTSARCWGAATSFVSFIPLLGRIPHHSEEVTRGSCQNEDVPDEVAKP
jgi:hypothetical protein